MVKELKKFEYLWTTQSNIHCLIRVGGNDDGDLTIFNLRDRMALTIEDDALYKTVVKKMLDSGIIVHDSLPSE